MRTSTYPMPHFTVVYILSLVLRTSSIKVSREGKNNIKDFKTTDAQNISSIK